MTCASTTHATTIPQRPHASCMATLWAAVWAAVWLTILATPAGPLAAADLELTLPLQRSVYQTNERIDFTVHRQAGPGTLDVALESADGGRMSFTLPATRGNDRLEFRIGGGAGPEPRAVRRDDFQRLDVFHRLAGHHGVRSARIVADHAAQRAATVRGGIRPEGQSVLFGSRLQRIAHRAGLDERRAPRWVDRDDIAHVLGEIQHHGHVHALPALRGAAATRQQRRTVLAADAQGGDHVVRRPGEHHADRDLAVVRGVRAVDRAAAGIEAHLARNGRGKCGGKGFGLLGTKRGLGCGAHGGPHSSR